MRPNRILSLSLFLMMAGAGLTSCGSNENEPKAPVFSQEINLEQPLTRIDIAQSVKVPVSVRNTSNFIWKAAGANPVHFSYHWLDADGKLVVNDGERTSLTEDLPPGATAKLSATVNAPPLPGNYRLLFTFVWEGVVWFDDHGAKATETSVKVEGK
jgi:uncharacterized protein YcfL